MQAAGVGPSRNPGPPQPETAGGFAAIVSLALSFISPARVAETSRAWLPRSDDDVPEDELVRQEFAAMALATNLTLFAPSGSGVTAFDRLARSGQASAQLDPEDAAMLRALCRAKFRLAAVEAVAADGRARLRDHASGEVFMTANGMPASAAGLDLVGWFDAAEPGLAVACLPLDAAARAVAEGFVKQGRLVNPLRCAEAVFRHVVRHGTLEVEGLNAIPGDEDDDGDELDQLARDWCDGGDRTEEDVHLIRSRSDLDSVLTAIAEAAYGRNRLALRNAYEEIAWIQLQTIHRRTMAGSGLLRLEMVSAAILSREPVGELPPGTHAVFLRLRHRLGERSHAAPDGGALDRLLARIQGLRAKTVEQGCTEEEALAAAEKVAELLDRYGLSLGELDLKQQACEGSSVETGRKRMSPLDDCVPSIAQFFDCRTWGEKQRDGTVRHVFFGLPADVAGCRYLYDLVEMAFQTETDRFRASDDYPDSDAGLRRTATNSFQIGLGTGISAKLRMIRASREQTLRGTSGRDLVVAKAAVVEDELAALGLAFKQRVKGAGRRVMTKVFEKGRATGLGFEYAPGIGQEGA